MKLEPKTWWIGGGAINITSHLCGADTIKTTNLQGKKHSRRQQEGACSPGSDFPLNSCLLGQHWFPGRCPLSYSPALYFILVGRTFLEIFTSWYHVDQSFNRIFNINKHIKQTGNEKLQTFRYYKSILTLGL